MIADILDLPNTIEPTSPLRIVLYTLLCMPIFFILTNTPSLKLFGQHIIIYKFILIIIPCSWTMTYEDLLSTTEPFTEPITLTVRILYSRYYIIFHFYMCSVSSLNSIHNISENLYSMNDTCCHNGHIWT